jgi:hypothetical protein
MTTLEDPSAYKGSLYTAPPTPHESSSVYTDKTVNTAGPNAQPVREFLIKFEYLQIGQQIPIINNHCHLLASLLVGGLYQRHLVMWDLVVSCGMPSQVIDISRVFVGCIYVREKGTVITRRWCHDVEEERHHDHVRCL